MDQNQSSIGANPRYIHEVMFSLNLALATVAAVFLFNHTLASILFRLDASINRFLRIRQTDLVWGYWAFFLSGAALALCIWVSLRLSSHTPFTREILRSVGGIAALAALPIYWLFATYSAGHSHGWNFIFAIQSYELVVILICLSFCLRRHWTIPFWASIVGIMLHYAFWFWQFGTYYLFTGNGGPLILLSIVGLSSSLAWLLYITRCLPHGTHPSESRIEKTCIS